MNVIEHRTRTEVTGGITVVTALADIPRLYLAVSNPRPMSIHCWPDQAEYKPDLSQLMADVSSTPYADYRA